MTSYVMVAHTIVGVSVVMSGVAAIFSRKGSRTHRLAGKCFVGFMILMGFIVAAGALLEPDTISSLGLLFAFFMNYLVLTAWYTVKKPEAALGKWDYLAPVAALSVCGLGVMLGLEALGSPIQTENAPPVGAYFFFALLAFIAMLLDANLIRRGGVAGKHRLLRHMWRMSCALFFATSTLFTGPGSIVFKEEIRDSIVLTIPQNLIILIAIYWIWKLFPTRISLTHNGRSRR